MITPEKLIIIPVHFALAERDDFYHTDESGNEVLNYFQPYAYRPDPNSDKIKMARLQKGTNMERFMDMISKGLVYRVSKASLDEFQPVVEFVRKEAKG